MIIVLAPVESLRKSIDALRAHFATPQWARFRESMAVAPPESMSVQVHEPGESLGLPG